MDKQRHKEEKFFLTCEKNYIFELLILAAGMMGAYTFILRGGVFCNAQTANVVLMGIAFGEGRVADGAYYLIHIGAYILGAIVSEIMPVRVRRLRLLRWDTILIAFEMIILFAVGFMPLSWPNQIVQVIINFLCSMQYNTFRQAQGITMATTFVTNHVRQVGVYLANVIKGKTENDAMERGKRHIFMLVMFFLGTLILAMFCKVLQEKAIWLALVPLGVCLGIMIHADLTIEKEMLEEAPHGH